MSTTIPFIIKNNIFSKSAYDTFCNQHFPVIGLAFCIAEFYCHLIQTLLNYCQKPAFLSQHEFLKVEKILSTHVDAEYLIIITKKSKIW